MVAEGLFLPRLFEVYGCVDEIPVKLAAANFSDGQKMVMLDRQHPNSIHLAIKDAVDQKGAGLYDFMIGLTGNQTDL